MDKGVLFLLHATDAVKLAVEVFVANVGHSWSRKLELGDLRRLFLRLILNIESFRHNLQNLVSGVEIQRCDHILKETFRSDSDMNVHEKSNRKLVKRFRRLTFR